MLIVDTHAHLFSPDEEKYPPKPDPSRPPEGAGTLEHLRREMRAAGVQAACAVQVSGFYGFDYRLICDAAAANPDWMAGVVTLDPTDPESPQVLPTLVQRYGIRGLRGVPAKGRLDDSGVRALWQSAYEHGLPVNLLCGHELADEADRLLRDLPDLNVVLDHSLQLENGSAIDEKLRALRRLARRPNCHAKVSNIANGPEGCSDGYPCESMHEPMLAVIDAFGPERCCWGAHFPLEKYAPRLTYRQHLAIYQEVLPLSATARREILGGTANRLWFEGRLRA